MCCQDWRTLQPRFQYILLFRKLLKQLLPTRQILEGFRDLLLEDSRNLSLEDSRNLSLEGSKDYVPNIIPSFSFEVSENYLEYWEHRPTPVQILSGQVQSLRYSQPGHTEMLRSIPITGVSRKRRTNSHDGFKEPIGSNFDNPIRVTMGIFLNIGPELVGRLNVVPITGFDSVSGCPVLCAVPGNVVSVNGFLKGKNGGESLMVRANFGSKLEVGANSGSKTED
uniref:Predicted protein n=1 Tax=Physcomitrium patens TaxID=3218 RepID=A9U4H1_PHYPA